MFSRKLAIGFGGLAVLVVVLMSRHASTSSDAGSPTDEVRKKVEAHLGVAKNEAAAALAYRLKTVQAVFARARSGAMGFSEDALSWSGKWSLIKGKLGIGDGDAHAAFLAEAFGKHVLSGDNLKSAIEGTVRGYLADLDAIENRLLVRLRADLADVGKDKLPALVSDDAFRKEYVRLVSAVAPTLNIDAGMEVGRQLAGVVVMDITTPIAIRVVELVAAELGVEAGILSVGAASGAATLGIGLIVGIVADQVIGWVLKEAGYDPTIKIAAKVCGSLNRVEYLLIEGTKQKAGLRGELERMANKRSKVRNAAISKLLKEGGMQ